MKMLDYQKMILEKVSFNANLFAREFKKSFKWLSREELNELVDWVKYRFTDLYNKITGQEKELKALLIRNNTKFSKK
ncbi:MAG: hypothetical protein Kow0068_23180 [Marinilabiliales bacterium]